MSHKEQKKYGSNGKKAFVNSITLSRLVAAFALIPIYNFVGGAAAAGFLTMMFCTDFIDGALARGWKVSSFFGSIADALSDKIISILAALLLLPTFPFAMGFMLGMETLILSKNLYEVKKGNNVQSTWTGKVKFWFLAAAIIGGYAISDMGTIIQGFQALPGLCQNIPWEPLRNVIFSIVNGFVSGLTPALEVVKENPVESMAVLSAPALIAQGLTLGSYFKKGLEQDLEREAVEQRMIKESLSLEELDELEALQSDLVTSKAYHEEIEKLQKRIGSIHAQKEKLQKLRLKSREEIMHGLFDTKYFEEHRKEPIRKLLYKPQEPSSEE